MTQNPPAATLHTTYYYDTSRKRQGWEDDLSLLHFLWSSHQLCNNGRIPYSFCLVLLRLCSRHTLPVSSRMTILLSWQPPGQFPIWCCFAPPRVPITFWGVSSSWPLTALSTVLPNCFKPSMHVLDMYFSNTYSTIYNDAYLIYVIKILLRNIFTCKYMVTGVHGDTESVHLLISYCPAAFDCACCIIYGDVVYGCLFSD